jgi:hypothetical protein
VDAIDVGAPGARVGKRGPAAVAGQLVSMWRRWLERLARIHSPEESVDNITIDRVGSLERLQHVTLSALACVLHQRGRL